MSENTSALEAQLREKEQLVAALTERLEQAAEQLDRIHRTGGDRGMRAGGGGLPPELVEQHRTLAEELQRAVQQWEDMQAAAALGRIELQLSELRDLVAGGLVPTGTLPPTGRPERSGPERAAASRPVQEPAGEVSAWEAVKASLLTADAAGGPHHPDEPPHDSSGGGRARDAGPPQSPALSLSELVPPTPPEPVDFDTADADRLRQAVEQRDAYIADVVGRLRTAAAHVSPPIDWSALAQAPEELRRRLESLETDFNARLRMAEVELSLERARLGREAARVRMMEQQVEKELKRLKVGDREKRNGRPDPDPHSDSIPKDKRNSRWRRMLGMGEEDE